MDELDGQIPYQEAGLEPLPEPPALIFSLHIEVYRIIFKFACRSPYDVPRYGLPEFSSEAITLSHVCGHWRAIALIYPDLWSTILYADPRPRSFLRLAAYLKRSFSNPVDVYLSTPSRGGYLDEGLYKRAVGLLLEHASRWRHISIILPFTAGFLVGFLSSVVENVEAPQLKSLEIDLPAVIVRGGPAHISFTKGTPTLTHFRTTTLLSRRCIPCSSILATLQLEEGRVMYLWEDLVAIVSECSQSLENLSIVGSVFKRPRQQNPTLDTIIASNLKHFRCMDRVVAMHLWHYLQAPKLNLLVLKSIDISCFNFPFDAVTIQSIGPPQPSFPSLRTLALIDVACEDEEQEPNTLQEKTLLLSYATQTVTHLSIADFEERSPVIGHVIAYQPSRILWPKLVSLTYDSDGINFEADGAPTDEEMTDILVCRRQLGVHCTLHLFDDDAKQWQKTRPDSWHRLVEGGHYEAVKIPRDNVGEDGYLPMKLFNPGNIFDEKAQEMFLPQELWRM